MGKILAVAIPKGGLGKTTTAVNLAASFAALEKRTLLIDTDPSGACSASVGFTRENTTVGILEVFNFSYSIPQVIQKTDLAFLDIVPSNIRTPHMEERYLKLAENRMVLKHALRGVSQRYDYIIIDCPPIMKGVTTNALTAADAVLVPVTSGHFSLDAVERLLRSMEWIREVTNKNLQLEGIVLTMYEGHTRVAEITERELRTKYRDHILNTIIPKNTSLAEASFHGKPALLFNAHSRGAKAYLELANEIIEKSQPGRVLPSDFIEQTG